MELELFKQKIRLPKKVSDTVDIKFKSFGFAFNVELTRINKLQNLTSTINVRIYIDKKITNSFDVLENLIVEKPYNFQIITIYSVFNRKFSEYILRDIN